MKMSEKENCYSHGPQADSFDDEFCPEIESSNSPANGSFLTISKYLEEADIFVCASRKYIDSTKQTISKLKNLITHAETDLSTADECVKEAESRMKTLKQELEAQFQLWFFERFENSVFRGRRDLYFYASEKQDFDKGMENDQEDAEELFFEHSRNVFAEDQAKVRNSTENAHNASSISAACSTAVETKLMRRKLDEARTSKSAIGSFFNDGLARQNHSPEIGHSFTNSILPSKASRSKQTNGNLPSEDFVERHSSDYNATKTFLVSQRTEESCDVLSLKNEKLAEYFEQSSSDSSDDLTPLLKECKGTIEDFNSETNRLNNTDDREIIKSREVALLNLSEKLGLSKEIFVTLLNSCQEVQSPNTLETIHRRQNERRREDRNIEDKTTTLHVDFNKISDCRGVVRMRPASSKNSSSKEVDIVSARDSNANKADLNGIEQKPLKDIFRKKKKSCLSNYSGAERTSQANKCLDLYRYHPQKLSTPNYTYKNKSTDPDLTFGITLNVDKYIPCTKEHINQDELRESDCFTFGSVSNSTTIEDSGESNNKDSTDESTDSSVNSFENHPSYISFNESHPTLSWYESNIKPSETRMSSNSSADGILRCSLSTYIDYSGILDTPNLSVKSGCQSSPISGNFIVEDQISTSSDDTDS